jgi:hypothetical protein
LLNDAPEYRPEALAKIEKHLLTDEVFLLLEEKGNLFGVSNSSRKIENNGEYMYIELKFL